MSKKFKKIVALLSVAASLFITSVSSVNAMPHLTVNAASSTPSISCQAHVQNIGWQGVVTSGVGISSTVGTEGRSLRLEDLKLRLNNASGGIKISTHVSCIGWLGYSSASSGNWAESGTTGRSLAIEAVKIELYGSVANSYNIMYRVHSQNIGWGNWVQNGAEAGTTGRGLRAEAIGIKLVAKNNVTVTTYYVKTNGANLTVRSGPSTGYTSIGKLSNGTAVSVYSISNGWAKIKFGSGTGYVSAAYLTQTKSNQTIVVTPSTTSQSEKYKKYNGVNYTSILNTNLNSGRIGVKEYNNRLIVLKEAQNMTTLLWTAPVTFHTWKGTSLSYNSNQNMLYSGNPETNYQFVKGCTYCGIPYAANAGNNRYNTDSWLSLINEKGITTQKLEGTVNYSGVDRTNCTYRGVDCSGFVYNSYRKLSNYDIGYLSTSGLLNSSSWKKINASEALPGDILLKSGHVMIFVGKTSDGKIAVMESVADGSNGFSGCRYYTFTSVSGYGYYSYKNINK